MFDDIHETEWTRMRVRLSLESLERAFGHGERGEHARVREDSILSTEYSKIPRSKLDSGRSWMWYSMSGAGRCDLGPSFRG